jgi:sortase A
MTYSSPRERSRRSLFLLWCSRVSMIAGLTALSFCGCFWIRGYAYQSLQSRRLQAAIPATSRGRIQDCHQAVTDTGDLIGQLDVPRIGLSVMVLEGDDAHTLRLGVGRVPGTGWPGRVGNLSIAGHRDTFFRELRDIRKDDVIRLTTPDASYTYRIESIRIVAPNHTEVMDGTDQPTLTLITCYPFHYLGFAPYRFVAHAIQSSSKMHPSAHACSPVQTVE